MVNNAVYASTIYYADADRDIINLLVIRSLNILPAGMIDLTSTSWQDVSVDIGDAYDTSDLALVVLPMTVVSSGALSDTTINIDGFHITLNQFESIAEDQSSIDDNGLIELNLFSRQFYSNAECQTDADILLENFKDPKLIINGTVDGFVDILPNQSLTIFDKEDDEFYTKPTKSITFTVAHNGKETTSITMGDFFKTDVEQLGDKFVEINKNLNLLESPYKSV